MSAYVAMSPWNRDNDFLSGYKRATKKKSAAAGWYNDSKGWSHKSSSEWNKNPKVEKRPIKLASGRTAYTYDDPDTEYWSFTQDKEMTRDMADYVDTAKFRYVVDMQGSDDKNSPNYKGHISRLEYAPYRNILRVTFTTDNSVFVYFRIPTTVFGELYWLAVDGTMQKSTVDGTVRHALGIKFWQLIRIRGNIHGGRYKFARSSEQAEGPKMRQGGYNRGAGAEQFIHDMQKAQDIATKKRDDAMLGSIDRHAKEHGNTSTSPGRRIPASEIRQLFSEYKNDEEIIHVACDTERDFLGPDERRIYDKLEGLEEKFNFLWNHDIGFKETYINDFGE